MTRFVRRLRDAVRRRSMPHTSMAALRGRAQIRAFEVRCSVPLLQRPAYRRISVAPGFTVISDEPERVNQGARPRQTVAGRAAAESGRRPASATAGEVALSVSTGSGSYSIHASASGAVLAEAAANRADRPTTACLLSVPPVAVGRLEVPRIGFEADTPQPLADILEHIDDAGFELAGERELVDHWMRGGSW
jgi:hypothetical protein